MRFLVVGLGGFVGAVLRYAVSGWTHRLLGDAFPWGTLVVNGVGCFLLGALMALVEEGVSLEPEVRTFVAIGLLGSFTTFSTFGHETLELVREGSFGWAAGNVAANVGVGLLAVLCGRAAAQAIS